MTTEEIFRSLPEAYDPSAVEEKLTYYFSVDDVKRTVTLTGDGCTVEEGNTVGEADCVCKTSKEFFEKIWNEGYTPTMSDFMAGKIKSNAPNLLKTFMESFTS